MTKPGTFTLSVTMSGYEQAREQVEVDACASTRTASASAASR